MPIDPNDERDVADQLAETIAPKAVSHLRDHWDEVVSAIPNGPARFVIRHNQNGVLNLVPTLAKVGAETALDEFGRLSIGDIARLLVKHSSDSGIRLHPTVAQAALHHV